MSFIMSVFSFLLTTKIPQVDAERQTQSPLQNCPNYTIEWITECGPSTRRQPKSCNSCPETSIRKMKQLEKRIDDTWRCKRELLKQIDEVETKKKQLKDLRSIRNPQRIDENELRHMRRVTLPFCSTDIPEEPQQNAVSVEMSSPVESTQQETSSEQPLMMFTNDNDLNMDYPEQVLDGNQNWYGTSWPEPNNWPTTQMTEQDPWTIPSETKFDYGPEMNHQQLYQSDYSGNMDVV
jgi:hypothetical protein